MGRGVTADRAWGTLLPCDNSFELRGQRGTIVTGTETNQLNPKVVLSPIPFAASFFLLCDHFLGAVGHPDFGVEKFLAFQQHDHPKSQLDILAGNFVRVFCNILWNIDPT